MTEDDLEVAEAEVEFALQNCPVEGVVSTPDGEPITFDALQALQARLKELERRPNMFAELTGEEKLRLQALVEYTVENCPVEGTARFHDGRPLLGSDVVMLAQKIGAIGLETLPVVHEAAVRS